MRKLVLKLSFPPFKHLGTGSRKNSGRFGNGSGVVVVTAAGWRDGWLPIICLLWETIRTDQFAWKTILPYTTARFPSLPLLRAPIQKPTRHKTPSSSFLLSLNLLTNIFNVILTNLHFLPKNVILYCWEIVVWSQSICTRLPIWKVDLACPWEFSSYVRPSVRQSKLLLLGENRLDGAVAAQKILTGILTYTYTRSSIYYTQNVLISLSSFVPKYFL